MPSGKNKVNEDFEIVKAAKNNLKNPLEKYSMVVELTRNMDLVLEKLEAIPKQTEHKSYNTNTEAPYKQMKSNQMHTLCFTTVRILQGCKRMVCV